MTLSEIEEYCYTVARGLNLTRRGEVVPIVWCDLGGWRGLADPELDHVQMASGYFEVLGRLYDMRQAATSTYLHEVAHRLTYDACQRAGVDILYHHYPFALLNWALHMRAQLWRPGADRPWWTMAQGPRWYDLRQEGERDVLDMAKWWPLALRNGQKLSTSNLTAEQIADRAVRHYIELTTPPPPPLPTAWQRLVNWFYK